MVAEVSAALRGALPVQPLHLLRDGHAGARPMFSRLARESHRPLLHKARTLCLQKSRTHYLDLETDQDRGLALPHA
jgi:hypothetical protein